jgi:hypothetical protein
MSEKFAENVSKSPEVIEAAKRKMAADSMNDHALEAAGHSEAVIAWLNEQWADRGFSPEQCVFALALVTINYRESLPEKYGGKAMFDRVASEARKYYDANK